MNINSKKCDSKKHEKINAISFCRDCRLYICDKCQIIHEESYNHHLISINSDKDDVFTGICNEVNHPNNLEYYCKNHNKLCCAACIVKLPKEGNGQHSKCNVCFIEDIKDEKKNQLSSNIKLLEDLSNNLENSIDELKKIYESIDEKKENIKKKIQLAFTKLRNALNEREDKLLLNIDEKFNNLFFKEEFIRKIENLPNKVKISLEKCNLISKEWDDKNKLYSFINDCIGLEDNIKNISLMNDNLNKWNSINLNVDFYINEDKLNNIIENLKVLGEIYYKNFMFKKCINEQKDHLKYKITGEKENIITKISDQEWVCVQTENELKKDVEYIWKIKLLKSQNKHIMIGVSPRFTEIEAKKLKIFDEFNLSLLITNIGLEQYNQNNPYIASLRDNVFGEEFLVSPNQTYKIIIVGKRTRGNLNLNGGIWYTVQKNGEPYDGFFGEFSLIEKLNNGYCKYYKNVKVPPGKEKGKVFIQLDQGFEGGSTSWSIINVSITKISIDPKNNKKNNIVDSNSDNCGYYIYYNNSALYADFPYNYRNKKTNLKIGEDILIVIDMKQKMLKLKKINDENEEICYKDIPINKPLYPTIFLYNGNDSLESIVQ